MLFRAQLYTYVYMFIGRAELWCRWIAQVPPAQENRSDMGLSDGLIYCAAD